MSITYNEALQVADGGGHEHLGRVQHHQAFDNNGVLICTLRNGRVVTLEPGESVNTDGTPAKKAARAKKAAKKKTTAKKK